MQRLVRTALATALIGPVLALAACSDNDADPMAGHDMNSSASATPQASASSTAAFNDADVMFAQMMIPHHEQAVAMSDMVLAKTDADADVLKLAQQIKAAQQPEIDTMNGWLEDWGQTDDGGGGMDHGSNDDGMMTEEEMTELDQADGPAGSKLYLDGMIKHHQGAITMAQTEIDGGMNPDAVAMAKTIKTTQQEEITTMQDMLEQL